MNGDFYLGNRSNFGKGDFYISKGKFSIEKDIYEFLQEDNFNASPPKTFFTEIPREKTENTSNIPGYDTLYLPRPGGVVSGGIREPTTQVTTP